MRSESEMSEYGGYIELEKFQGKEYHENAIALNSGRGCVEYLIKARKIRKLYIPFFLCSSVKAVCEKLHVSVEYYHTNMQFTPDFDVKLGENEWLYLVNYYGQITNDFILGMKQKYHNIIVDNVQAFFQKPVENVDTIYSCRKYFGVADGAYLYTNAVYSESMEQDYSCDRMHFLLGRYEKGASLFYEEYVTNNKFFAEEPVKRMSALTHNLLCSIDYDETTNRRTCNFSYLDQCFCDENKLKLKVPEGGFMYPLYIENGEKIREKLIQNKIYVPTLWPDVFTVCDSSNLEYDMAKNILPLPIDQRYDLDDMKYIADEVEKQMKG